ncbi:MAG: hypothetical protein ABI400_03740, partial [Lacisediminihabitans sp.]
MASVPGDLDGVDWFDAEVPGTVASALAAHQVDWTSADIDGHDWWYRTSFAAVCESAADLEWDGLAAFTEIWLNGRRVAETSTMFVTGRVPITSLAEHNELVVRFRSVRTELAGRRPRPRWRVARLVYPNLRWERVSLWGRLNGAVPVPPVVGPWRELRMVQDTTARIVRRRLTATPTVSGGGIVGLEAEVRGESVVKLSGSVTLRVGDATSPASIEPGVEDGSWIVRGVVELGTVDLWWPLAAGRQPLYDVTITVGGQEL